MYPENKSFVKIESNKNVGNLSNCRVSTAKKKSYANAPEVFRPANIFCIFTFCFFTWPLSMMMEKRERVIIRCLMKSKYTLGVSPKPTAEPETFTTTPTILPRRQRDGAVKFSYGCFTMPCPFDFHNLKSIEFKA
jgi:hypothetical protein